MSEIFDSTAHEPAAESSGKRSSAFATRAKENCTTARLQLQKQLEDGLSEFKAEITERPFLYLAMAFIAGFISWTFPVRLIYSALRRLVSFLLGPAILLIGILKISEIISAANREQGTTDSAD
jgi:hypothetical protein